MAWWTYVNGVITVSPIGRTQAEKRYILDTVLDHLPIVTGMNVYVIQKSGYDLYSSCDEFGKVTNHLTDYYGHKNRRKGMFKIQGKYILVIEGSCRDRIFEQTYKEFQKWLCRLAKRVKIEDVLVEINDYGKSIIVRNTQVKDKETAYGQMYEYSTWYYKQEHKCSEPNWCEYLMWERAKDSYFPMMLTYKYFEDEETDKEVERRLAYNG